jgi:hypothetical protein
VIGTSQTNSGRSTALQEIDGGRRTARFRRGEASNAFDRDGFLIVPDLRDPALLSSARAETVAICRGERGNVDGVVPADRQEDDDDVLRRYLCIHFPHKISPLARDLAALPAAVDVLTDVIGPNVKMMQSMLFIKSEGKPARRGTRTRPTSRRAIDL